MAQANTPVFGYPQPWGSKIAYLFDHSGPASYVQYNASTGAGDIINASDLGFGGFEFISTSWAGYSNSGNYILVIQQSKANESPKGSADKRFTVQWFTTSAAFGAISTEVSAAVDLSAEYGRLKAICV